MSDQESGMIHHLALYHFTIPTSQLNTCSWYSLVTMTNRVYEYCAQRVSPGSMSKGGQGVCSTLLGSWSSPERYAARTTSSVRRPSSPLAPDGSSSATPRRKSTSMSAFMSSLMYDQEGAPVSWWKVLKGCANGSTSRTPEVPEILNVTSPQVG